MKEKLERMRQRNVEARKSLERAERCLKANPIDCNGATMFLDEAQSFVGLQQLEIDQLKHERMSDAEYEELKAIVAEHANFSFRINNMRSKIK